MLDLEWTSGWARCEFTDRRGIKCGLQMGAVANPAPDGSRGDLERDGTTRFIALGPLVEYDEIYRTRVPRMQLTREQVAAILPHLRVFAESGALPEFNRKRERSSAASIHDPLPEVAELSANEWARVHPAGHALEDALCDYLAAWVGPHVGMHIEWQTLDVIHAVARRDRRAFLSATRELANDSQWWATSTDARFAGDDDSEVEIVERVSSGLLGEVARASHEVFRARLRARREVGPVSAIDDAEADLIRAKLAFADDVLTKMGVIESKGSTT